MMDLYDELIEDVHFRDGFNSCMNCGICTAICPAAEFYNYDPRIIVNTVQRKNNEEIEALLKSETIWYCGECMSCKTRCPRGNAPGLIIMALRRLSQLKGYFIESEKGRQQLAIKRTVGENMLYRGYCVYPDTVIPELHPEQGPVWEWVHDNTDKVMGRMGANYGESGPGTLRETSKETLQEIQNIFDVSGGTELYNTVEKFSKQKAEELNIDFDETNTCEYFLKVFTENNGKHSKY